MSDWGYPSGYGRIIPISIPYINLANGAANTKGAYTQLTASLGADIDALLITGSVVDVYNLVDVAVGASGSEVVVVPNFFLNREGDLVQTPMVLPCKIPQGTRVAARYQSNAGGGCSFILNGICNPFFNEFTGGAITDYGTDLANSRGTLLTTSGSGTTAYVQIVASTTYAMRRLIIEIAANATAASAFDISVGAAGSEQVIFNTGYTVGRSTGGMGGQPISIPCSIPDGSRLSIRSNPGYAANAVYVMCHGIN